MTKTPKKMTVYPFTGCCGAYIIHGFYETGPWFVDPANLAGHLDVTLKDYTGRTTSKVPAATPDWSSVGGPPLFVCILTQAQREVFGKPLTDYGFVEIAAGYNYANDCHLYVLTRKGPRHTSRADFEKLPGARKSEATVDAPFRDASGKFAKRAAA